MENYPGFPEIDDFELMMKYREQTEKYNVQVIDEDVVSIERLEDCFHVTTDQENT